MSAVFDIELPELSTDQPPAFADAPACRQWLAELPPTNARQTQAQLLRQLNLLNRYALAPEERLLMLEALRGAAQDVHGECAARFISRPLPLTPPEQAALETCQTIWQAVETGYLHCLEAFLAQAAHPVNEIAGRKIALAATRALFALQSQYVDNCLAGMLPAKQFWRRLHRIYRGIEKLQLAKVPVESPLSRESSTTVAAAYVEVMLISAAYPLELSPDQLGQMIHWAQSWSSRVYILPSLPADPRTPPLCVDLAGDEKAVFTATPGSGESLRWLDLIELRKTMKHRLAALAAGESPVSLGLGKDCIQPDCEIFLGQVYQDWCRGGRDTSVQGGSGSCQLVNGLEAVHYFLSGEVFRAQGEASPPRPEDEARAQSYGVEDWQELSENINNILLQRPLAQPGGRLVRGQLVAVRTSSNDSLQVGKVYWVAIGTNRDTLICGIHPMPGPAVAAALRAPDAEAGKSDFHRGFLLPAFEALKQPASLLTPPGWYRPNRVIEVHTDGTATGLRLSHLIESGVDFDRCAYAAA